MKHIFKIIAIIAVVVGATVIAAQEQEEASLVKAMVLIGRGDLQKAVAKADADYSKRLAPSERRLELLRCRSVVATCNRTITALERVAASATRSGADVEAAMAKGKIATVKEYLAKAQADMPKVEIKPKTAPIKLVNTLGVRMKFGRHSYLAILRKTTWDEANRMAKAYGGYLASGGSSQELLFLQKVICTQSWLGGGPGGEPVQWQWQDGKKIIETFWGGKEPDMKLDHRVAITGNGLKVNGANKYLDAFIIEWDR